MDHASPDVGKRITHRRPAFVGSSVDRPAQERGQADQVGIVAGVKVAEFLARTPGIARRDTARGSGGNLIAGLNSHHRLNGHHRGGTGGSSTLFDSGAHCAAHIIHYR
jgi:hypothetical protein